MALLVEVSTDNRNRTASEIRSIVTKAGGSILMEGGSAAEVDKLREILKRRLLRALSIPVSRGQKLVPEMPRTK